MTVFAARVAHPLKYRERLRYHVVAGVDRSACDAFKLLLDAVPVPAKDVPLLDRCLRPGCKQKWPR
jgi:hypothetical protein